MINPILLKRSKIRLDNLKLQNELSSNIYKHNQDMYAGVESLPITLQSRNNNELTAAERRGDPNFTLNQFNKKVYKLFNNDKDDSNMYISLFRNEYSSPLIFNSIYSDLLKAYQNVDYPEPNDVFNTTQTMINNFQTTASATTSKRVLLTPEEKIINQKIASKKYRDKKKTKVYNVNQYNIPENTDAANQYNIPENTDAYYQIPNITYDI